MPQIQIGPNLWKYRHNWPQATMITGVALGIALMLFLILYLIHWEHAYEGGNCLHICHGGWF